MWKNINIQNGNMKNVCRIKILVSILACELVTDSRKKLLSMLIMFYFALHVFSIHFLPIPPVFNSIYWKVENTWNIYNYFLQTAHFFVDCIQHLSHMPYLNNTELNIYVLAGPRLTAVDGTGMIVKWNKFNSANN